MHPTPSSCPASAVRSAIATPEGRQPTDTCAASKCPVPFPRSTETCAEGSATVPPPHVGDDQVEVAVTVEITGVEREGDVAHRQRLTRDEAGRAAEQDGHVVVAAVARRTGVRHREVVAPVAVEVPRQQRARAHAHGHVGGLVRERGGRVARAEPDRDRARARSVRRRQILPAVAVEVADGHRVALPAMSSAAGGSKLGLIAAADEATNAAISATGEERPSVRSPRRSCVG